jgi:hypothetical protein
MRKQKSDADTRLKTLLPLIQSLPEEQRSNLADFLEALLNAHRLLEADGARRRNLKKA